uniref:cation:proton antiporter domain-containing protein n=1 Tax=Cephaloticoccus sp. TaxID=1985742 RepID=UPI00404A2BEF
MDGINFIQDLAIVLLAAGIAGVICKRIGLSVIVGYLAAGIVIGPYTPPFSYITDVNRIQTLSQLGLVFLMFAIGLGLSLTKLGRMGLPTLLATGVGALLVLNFTEILGSVVGWSSSQSLFIAGMFMVSSSAVIAKIVTELNLNHEGAAQRALGITVMEDVVAVVMLTVLASQSSGNGEGDANVGSLLAVMSAFIVLLVGGGLLLVPRLFRRLEARADPELQTIIVAGVLLMLAIAAAKAGYSLALGAFLLGAIVAEMPQKGRVELSFAGMRDIFSSVFFVSIGMMIEVKLLWEVWPWILGLFAFVMIARPLATGLAMTLCGTDPREARRASLLLSPLGEFSFIIAQLGVSKAILPPSYYPLAVGVSLLTVLATPVINRQAEPILRGIEWLHPRWLLNGLEAYHGWLRQLQKHRTEPLAQKVVRKRLIQILVEMLFVSGLLIFSPQLFTMAGNAFHIDWLERTMLGYGFWSVVGLIALALVLAVWRNVVVIAMITAQGVDKDAMLPANMVEQGIRTVAAIAICYWLYLILPVSALPIWGWGIIVIIALVLVRIYSKRLIYWHSSWQSSLQEVFSQEAPADESNSPARHALHQGLESWGMRLDDFYVPDHAVYAGQDLGQLDLPSKSGCSVIEIERNNYLITTIKPDLRIYPGDRLLLLGKDSGLAEARALLQGRHESQLASSDDNEEFNGSILESAIMPDGPHAGKTLTELQVARATGARIIGIQRAEERIINPAGNQIVQAGDDLLVVGTLKELRAFRAWVRPAVESA